MTTQLDKITAILTAEGKIDNYRSIRQKISIRLGARIADLKDQGWQFKGYYEKPSSKNYVYEVIKKPKK